MNIKKGDVVVILEGNPAEFIAVNPSSAQSPFTIDGRTLTCTPAYYIAIDDDRVQASSTIVALDNNGQTFRNLIGGRPRNIIRR